ncbi:MAG: hypothetical protein ABFR62_13100 [Bacteroidota bacterium]
MKKQILILLIFPLLLSAQDSIKTEKPVRVVPLLTSTPLMGIGVGMAVSYVYMGDKSNSSKSQLQVGGQYTNTHSYSVYGKNILWLKNNDILSATGFAYNNINNEFDKDGTEVAYNVKTTLLTEILMFRVSNKFYAGIPLSYKYINYEAISEGGESFIFDNGMLDEQSGGFGLAFSYDSRKNKYYPIDSGWITARVHSNPSWLGAINTYHTFVLDGRYYAKGFGEEDVWAWQFYGQYSSDKTPDSGLPTISGKSILRGYPSGKYKARYQSGVQSEYRYTINNTRFRVVGFFGVANLSGGSYGVDGRSRMDDGWYTSEGLGIRYKLQQATGVDLSLDLVHNSDNEFSMYLKLNQAF